LHPRCGTAAGASSAGESVPYVPGCTPLMLHLPQEPLNLLFVQKEFT